MRFDGLALFSKPFVKVSIFSNFLMAFRSGFIDLRKFSAPLLYVDSSYFVVGLRIGLIEVSAITPAVP